MVVEARTLAILCGGRSRRFGSDKGLYVVDGEPLVARALRLLGEGYAELLVIVKDEAQRHRYREALGECSRLRIVTDESQDEFAALLGLEAALNHARTPFVSVVPVDQIGVRRHHLRRLDAALIGAAAACFKDDSGTELPFPSLWRGTAIDAVQAAGKVGAFSVRRLLQKLGASTLPHDASLTVNANRRSEAESYFGEPLFDPNGRRLHYLRFSLTEACNMACTYCLPDGFPEWYRHKARLDRTQVATLLSGFRRLGFRKVRFTGGEPTLHPHCLEAIAKARDLGYEQIAMTTNGTLIKDLSTWVDAGLDQLNISLDSLDAATFTRLTKSRSHARVLTLIDEAIALGLEVKVNTVLMRSSNAAEAAPLIDWALSRPLTLRFIELMPTGLNAAFYRTEQVLSGELLPLLAERGLQPRSSTARTAGPAVVYGSATHLGAIGLISPLSCNFCSLCNRLRVTARGALKLCLFGDRDLPLSLESSEAVARQVRSLIGQKPARHALEQGEMGNVATFRNIGG